MSAHPDSAQVLATLEKLPPLRGASFRGCAADAGFVRDGQTTVLTGVVPSTRNLGSLLMAEPPAIYALLLRTGRDISPFSASRGEREVAILPGTLLHLAETRTLDGRQVRLVFELDPADVTLPDDLPDRFAEELGRTLVSAGLSREGPARARFIGDLA